VECGEGTVDERRVALVGDSLSVQAEAALRDAVGDVLVDACNGRTIVHPIGVDDGLSRIDAVRAAEAEWWVVALGTNDAAYASRPPDTVRASTRQLLDAIGPDACVTWALPAVQAPATQVAIDNVVAAQQVIAEELSRQSCQRVIDWPGAVAAEPALLGPDGIHLTAAGEERLAELVADAVDD
jgi:lysophospholipase L1-like esterase